MGNRQELDGAQRFYRAQREDSPTGKRKASGRGGFPVVTVLLGISLLANGGLGYAVYDLRRDVDESETRLQGLVEEAKSDIDEATAAALSRLPEIDELQEDVEALSGDFEDMEDRLFGFVGTPSVGQDLLGHLEQDIADLKACVNRLVSDLLFDSLFLSRCY